MSFPKHKRAKLACVPPKHEPEVVAAKAARKLRTSHVEFSPDWNNEALACPRCGGEYLHHLGVNVYDRVEDAEQTIETRVENGAASVSIVPSSNSRNPSLRRDGIAIQFACEFCNGTLELTLAQHKGATLVVWRAVS